MNLRFGTWNVNSRTRLGGQLELIHETRCDLLALQEVRRRFFDSLLKNGLFHWGVFSLDLRPPKVDEPPGRQLGCAVFGSRALLADGYELLAQAPLPERTLVVRLATPLGHITACSFHAPPGVTWGDLKPLSFNVIARWLADNGQRRTVFGMDANTPKTDHPDPMMNEWWWEEERNLLGPNPTHELRDAFRVYLQTNPRLMTKARSLRPNGPLAISFVRGSGMTRIPCRYDFIYVTPDIQVDGVHHFYDEATAAGSDHALVVADLRINRHAYGTRTKNV